MCNKLKELPPKEEYKYMEMEENKNLIPPPHKLSLVLTYYVFS